MSLYVQRERRVYIRECLFFFFFPFFLLFIFFFMVKGEGNKREMEGLKG